MLKKMNNIIKCYNLMHYFNGRQTNAAMTRAEACKLFTNTGYKEVYV